MIRLTDNLTAHCCDNLELLAVTPAKSVDVICIDPPYLYLKNQKLERPFDAPLFFTECRRVLKDTGFIVMFGRGSTFYRWNVLLEDLGFNFKESVTWDKGRNTSPVHQLMRVHEEVSIHAKTKAGVINKVRTPYLEKKKLNPESIAQDIRVIKNALGKDLTELLRYVERGEVNFLKESTKVHRTTKQNCKELPRGVSALIAVTQGMRETSIIKVGFEGRETAHPTQKPARLLERLLALVVPQNVPPSSVMVADYFGGSFSLLRACYNAGYTGVACEIDEEFYNAGVKATQEYIEQKEIEFLKSF